MPENPELLIVEHVLDAVADQRLQAGTKLGEQALSDLFPAIARMYAVRWRPWPPIRWSI